MKRRIRFDQPNIVGTIHTFGGFAAAQKIPVDLVEVRVDALPKPVTVEDLKGLPCPALVTVRREDEGGARPIPDAVRAELYGELLPVAAAIDVELRSFDVLSDVIKEAQARKIPIVASFHDFECTPSAAQLRAVVKKARARGADVVKIAAKTEYPADVARLLALLEAPASPIAVMGMGTLGRASRLLLAKAGSVLNYAWLHQPQVSGQWSAKELGDLLARA